LNFKIIDQPTFIIDKFWSREPAIRYIFFAFDDLSSKRNSVKSKKGCRSYQGYERFPNNVAAKNQQLSTNN